MDEEGEIQIITGFEYEDDEYVIIMDEESNKVKITRIDFTTDKQIIYDDLKPADCSYDEFFSEECPKGVKKEIWLKIKSDLLLHSMKTEEE